jgi:hypothetical protein
VVESRVSQIHSSAVVRLRSALAGLRTHNAASGAKKVMQHPAARPARNMVA